MKIAEITNISTKYLADFVGHFSPVTKALVLISLLIAAMGMGAKIVNEVVSFLYQV